MRIIGIAIHFSKSTKKQGFLKLLVRRVDTIKRSQTLFKGRAKLVDSYYVGFFNNKVAADFCPIPGDMVDFHKTGTYYSLKME